ncbi:MAG: YihY/virulence factor BrkB family protein [Acidimicrobiales bacterium]
MPPAPDSRRDEERSTIDRITDRLGWLRTPLAVHRRVGDLGGGPLASSITLASFLSLFPLLLVGVAVVGFLSANDTDFAARAVDYLGLTGSAADLVLEAIGNAESSRRTASVVGFAGLVWAGLGVVGTLAQAFDTIWQVKGRPGWRTRLRSLAWLAGAGTLYLGALALGPTAATLPGPAAVPTVLLGLAAHVVLFVWMFRVLTNVTVPWTDHLPGAIALGLGLGVLQLASGIYLPRAASSWSALYGSLGVVFALLAWLAIAARLVVYAAAFNVVRHEQRHGTVTVGIEVPRIEGEVPLEVTRGGAVSETEAGAGHRDQQISSDPKMRPLEPPRTSVTADPSWRKA